MPQVIDSNLALSRSWGAQLRRAKNCEAAALRL
jgi:hypothetical protein